MTQRLDRPQPGWQLLSPGVYCDAEGQMHFFVDQMLLASGYADTPANRDMLVKAIAAQAGNMNAEFKFAEPPEKDKP